VSTGQPTPEEAAGPDPDQAAAAVRHALGVPCPPTALVLGSGLSGLRLDGSREIPYERLPGWPSVGVAGHAGVLALGSLAGVPLVCLRGRAHLYEGHSPAEVVFPVRVLAALGVRTLILTNAAGSLNAMLPPGRLMSVADHLNLMWRAPGAGIVRGPGSPRSDLVDCYDPGLRRHVAQSALDAGIPLRAGVYAGVLGPSYETPAEVRMLRAGGADAVGMSTVPEAIMAWATGMRVAAVSCITNFATGIGGGPLSHADVVRATDGLAPTLARLLRHALPQIATSRID
jgi:purine-nucleoside phosphorylase